ncbi:MAG: hypothetical protein KF802_01920 [Bdellovibrionaceae bacterium]|nr:hypothetical protein [Pseudobdellovibrionaceae bacterium]
MTKTESLKTALALMLLGLSSAAFAQNPVTAAPLSEVQFQRQVQRLSQVIAPRVKRVERELITFSYYSFNPEFDQRLRTLTDAQKTILRKPLIFSDPSHYTHDMMAGPGLYVATDPYASRGYGGEKNPSLYVLTLKKNGLLLDVRGENGTQEKSALEEIHEQMACLTDNNVAQRISFGYAVNVITHFRDSLNQDCRRLIIQSLQQLHVGGILYDYTSSNSLPHCLNTRAEAINIIDPNAIDADVLAYYSDTKKIEGNKPLTAYVRHLYQEASEDYELFGYLKDMAMPAVLAEESTAYPLYKHWKRKKIFKCGPLTQLEKSSDEFEPLHKTLRLTYQSKERHRLLARFRLSLERRFPDSINTLADAPGRLKEIEEMEYLASGGPADLSGLASWQKAKDLLVRDQDDEQNIAQSAALLGENPPHGPSRQEADQATLRILSSSPDQNRSRPGLIPFQLSRIQAYGPRLTRLQANMIILDFGGAPLLTARLPLDPHGEEKELSRQNDEIFQKILRSCLTIYNDPGISNEEIQAGPCAYRPLPGR